MNKWRTPTPQKIHPHGKESQKSAENEEKNDPIEVEMSEKPAEPVPQTKSPKINPKNLCPERKVGKTVDQISYITGIPTPTQTITRTADGKGVVGKEHNTGGALSMPMEIDNRGKRERVDDASSKEDVAGKKTRGKHWVNW